MVHRRPQKELLQEEDTESLFSPGTLSADLTEESSVLEILNQSISTDKSEIRNLVLLALDLTLCLRSQSTGHYETEDVSTGTVLPPEAEPIIRVLQEEAKIDPYLNDHIKRVISGKAELQDWEIRRKLIYRIRKKLDKEAGRGSSKSDSDEEMDKEVKSTTQESTGIFHSPQDSSLDQIPKSDNTDVVRPPPASCANADLLERSLHPETAAFFLPQIQELLMENRRLRNELNEAQSAMKVQDEEYQHGGNETEYSRGSYEHSEDSAEQSEFNNDSKDSSPDGDHDSPLRMIYAHLVVCNNGGMNYFEDSPRLFKGDYRKAHLRGRIGINLHLSLQHPSDIAFAVIKRHECSCGEGPTNHHVVGYEKGRLVADAPAQDTTSEHIWMNDSLLQDLQTIIAENPEEFEGFNSKGYSPRFFAPYLLFYVHNATFMKKVTSATLEPKKSEALGLLCTWFEDNWRNHWNKAEEEFSRGRVTQEHYPLLFRPHELIVSKAAGYSRDHSHDDSFRVEKIQSYPWVREEDRYVDLMFWNFNGLFQSVKWTLSLTWELSYERWDGEKDITSLRFFPLRFWGAEGTRKLVLRGHQFWKCRTKRLVAYRGNMDGDSGGERTEVRFMVDYDMFRRMHPKKAIFASQANDLGEEAMAKDEPPDDDFLAMMPSKIHAFELATKAWKEINVDRITEVSWNKDAFKHLVIAKEDKELIEAAITAHGNKPISSPDIIAGKGQGLLILLHGGPGTGKTLTAESIAEAQERPLYRVTCGDIGIEPTEAESYLQTVLTLGETWGCVILMDEADVFLEERNIADQKQNAFVSVFLRLLEYYNGTVILTTNRVGTFDEAFKSRIHLALKYQNLDEEQRAGIWRNFIDMLRRTKDLIDVEDLERNLPKLAQIEMNGRQIRNTLTIARYLAKFRKQVLVYKHIQDAVASVVKFDQYLTTLRGSDDHWARDARLR